MMNITVQDDFDLNKIIMSGQCFRAKRLEDDIFRFITGKNVLYLQEIGQHEFSASCNEQEWESVWKGYFDLDRDYRKIREQAYGKHAYVQTAIENGKGLRILRQEPWEMLITFIVSQRKSIPAISKIVEILAKMYGERLETAHEVIFAFPSQREMEHATAEELKRCGLGYRIPYVNDAVQKVTTGILNLDEIASCNTAELLNELQKIYGVGKKVANCVALFAYGRMSCVPVDVWISRAIREECAGEDPFPLYGEDAGIMQQYVFYYQKSRRSLL